MDELNLSEIEKKLNAGFAAGNRLIFWYDKEASFEDSVDSLNLGNVKILHLTDRNSFRTKMLLEHDDPDGQYLIYAPFAKPPVEKDHLEDTLLYSKEFHADKMSLIAADLGLPARLRNTLSSYGKFFGIGKQKLTAVEKKEATKRTNAFISRATETDLSTADEGTIAMLLMCTVANARNTTNDDLLYAVFSYGDIGEQDIIRKFEELELEDRFWKLCNDRFGFSDPKPTLLKFVMSLFAIDTFRDHPESVPKAWKIYAQDDMKKKASNTAVLLENMMNNVLYQEKFDEISGMAAQELHAEETLASVKREDLLTADSFRIVDQLIIRWIIDREIAEDQQAELSGLSIPEICKERMRMHFGGLEKSRYEALLAGYSLLKAVNYAPKETLQEMIDTYVKEDYKIDTDYRKYITCLDEMSESSAFEKLTELLENIYLNEYLGKTVLQWNTAISKNGIKAQIAEQRNFYEEKVNPLREKVAIIISDAFRYEAAMELCSRFKDDPSLEVTINPMLTALPSVTMIGMAELLPHGSICLEDDGKPSVSVDGKATASTELREKILKDENPASAAIDYDSLTALKSKELKDFTSGKEVICIYHNRIDVTGEAPKTENSVFAAVEKAIDEIYKIVRHLSKNGNVYRFYVTSDHGFIYTRRKLQETDKLENFGSKDAIKDRRFIIDRKEADGSGVYSMPLGETLLNDDSRYISLAKGMSVFKCGGGMNYVHGGASPQEMIVPSIFVKAQKGQATTEDVKFSLITNIHKVTGIKVKLDFYQEQAVTDKVKSVIYRINFEAEDGELLSNVVLYKADSTATQPGERSVALHFDIKKRAYNNDQKYYLVIRKDETGTETERRRIIMDLPFTDDFGFDI